MSGKTGPIIIIAATITVFMTVGYFARKNVISSPTSNGSLNSPTNVGLDNLQTPVDINSDEHTPLVVVHGRGGSCPKSCETSYTIYHDGKFEARGSGLAADRTTTIGRDDLNVLRQKIAETNYAFIRLRPMTGACPSTTDGQELEYTIYTADAVETFSNCQNDLSLEPFQTINTVIFSPAGLN